MRGRLSVGAVHVVAVLLLCAAVVSPAEAQLGRLKKAAQDLAKDKLAKKDGKDGAEATAVAAGKASGTSESVVITSDFVELVLSSMETSVADADRLQKAKRASTEYAKQQATAQACMEKLTQSSDPSKLGALTESRLAEITRLGNASNEAQLRANAAMQRDDQRTYFATQDTAQVLLQQSALLTIGGSCAIPYAPIAVIDAQLAENAGIKPPNLEATVDAKARMSHTQFGRVRERIALWALLQDDPTLKVGSEGVFTESEQEALNARGDEIKRMTTYFKDNTLRWSTWGDVTSW